MAKNIAFCFYGQLRLPHLIENFYSKWNERQNRYNFDFYISTWNDFKNTEIFSYFTKTEYIKFSKTFLPKNKGNTRKMGYLLKSVNKLVNESETKYDYIIYTRPDVLFELDSILNLFDENWKELTYNKNTVITLSPVWINSGTPFIDSDVGFIATPLGFDNHSKLYDECFGIDKKYLSQKEGGHACHGIILTKNVDSIIDKKISYVLVRPTRDIDLLNKNFTDTELIHKIYENESKWKPSSNPLLSCEYIEFGNKLVNFKESIIQ
jgi:hypothetical protein